MTMTAPEPLRTHLHSWDRDPARCDCGLHWDEWLREAYG